MKDNEDFIIEFNWTKVVLAIAFIIIIIGIVFCFQTQGPGEICIAVGIWLICGYITNKLLQNKKGSFLIGCVFGIIGIIIAIIMRTSNNNNDNINNTSKYDNLEKLQKLKDSGAITESEFEIEKQKILK